MRVTKIDATTVKMNPENEHDYQFLDWLQNHVTVRAEMDGRCLKVDTEI